jgi:hypothetical protein
VALTVSPAEATTSVVGSLTSRSDHISPAGGGDHLSTGGQRLHQCARRGLRSRPRCGSEGKTIKNAAAAPWRTTSCTASQCSWRSGRSRGCGRPTHSATIARAVDRQPRSAPATGCRATQTEKPGTRQLTAPQTANALLPQTLREEAGRYPRGGRASTRHTPSPAWMMNILEVEGRREAAAQFASPHHKAGSHPSG